MSTTFQKWSRYRAWPVIAGLLALYIITCSACAQRGSNSSARRGKPDTQSAYLPKSHMQFNEVHLASLQVALPQVPNAEYVNDDSLCMTCHEAYAKSFQHNIHRGQSCEKCHGPASQHLKTRGKEPGMILNLKKLSPPERSEICLQCHQQDACQPGNRWRTSVHAHKGVACTDCHTSHYNVPPGTPTTQLADASVAPHEQLASYIEKAEPAPAPVDMAALRQESRHMGAITPQVCYRCHANKQEQQEIAASHQICGAVGFDCTTCHDPHGNIRTETRTDLCLKCHDLKSPTMAWHSSTHSLYGVACVDCHSPHPNQNVPKVVEIQHTNVRRAPRMPMSVNEPTVCYGCHADIYGRNAMPSHHPIKEGKMTCTGCHDPHGQDRGNLKEATVNLVCYKCHAEKQGPFAYEHAPVSENCDICHNPHGTVANHLLQQPTTFLCLRCHTGHRTGPSGPNHNAALNTPAGTNSQYLGDIGKTPAMQRAFYSDCTQCHSQIHGSDLPSQQNSGVLMR